MTHLILLFPLLMILAFVIYREWRLTKQNRFFQSGIFLETGDNMLNSFLHATKDAVNITVLNGTVIYMNSAFEQERKRSLLNGKSFSNIESGYLRKDGSFIDVNVTLTPIHDAEQNITAFAAITRDESYRKQAELELRE